MNSVMNTRIFNLNTSLFMNNLNPNLFVIDILFLLTTINLLVKHLSLLEGQVYCNYDRIRRSKYSINKIKKWINRLFKNRNSIADFTIICY